MSRHPDNLFNLTIEMNGNAFSGEDGYEPHEELARVLQEVTNSAAIGNTSGKCLDLNGNTCGSWEIG